MSCGTLYIVSAPSGAGKHAIIRQVLASDPRVEPSVSSTTRAPRAGEVDGKDYYFFSKEEFCRRIENGDFAEWAEVHGNLYGTLRSELMRHLESNRDVILQIDVQGMRSMKGMFPDVVAIFVMPPSIEALEQRLRTRGANSEDDIQVRLSNSEGEIALSHFFDYIIVNDKLEDAVADMRAILRAQRLRANRVLAQDATAERKP